MHRPNRARCVNFREVTVTIIRRQGERGIRRQSIAQGRPSVRRHLYAAVRFPCATLSRSGPRVPVGTRSSLRPLRERRGERGEQNSGVWCRENADPCLLHEMKWCCQTGLNCRPLHYQWSALPLSYGSMCWDQNRPPKGPTKRPISATGPPAAQACKDGQSEKIGAISGAIRLFWPETTDFPPILVRFPRPTGQLAHAGDSSHFEFRTIGTARAS